MTTLKFHWQLVNVHHSLVGSEEASGWAVRLVAYDSQGRRVHAYLNDTLTSKVEAQKLGEACGWPRLEGDPKSLLERCRDALRDADKIDGDVVLVEAKWRKP